MINVDGGYVYKLINDDEVVYIGKTNSLISRLYTHKNDKDKEFDRVEYELCATESIDAMEFAYICKYNPPLNAELPVIPHSVRETAARNYNKCISEDMVDKIGFNFDLPDYKTVVGGVTKKLWAKKGEEDRFFSQIDNITRLINKAK